MCQADVRLITYIYFCFSICKICNLRVTMLTVGIPIIGAFLFYTTLAVFAFLIAKIAMQG